jgi:hypothetical protein
MVRGKGNIKMVRGKNNIKMEVSSGMNNIKMVSGKVNNKKSWRVFLQARILHYRSGQKIPCVSIF